MFLLKIAKFEFQSIESNAICQLLNSKVNELKNLSSEDQLDVKYLSNVSNKITKSL